MRRLGSLELERGAALASSSSSPGSRSLVLGVFVLLLLFLLCLLVSSSVSVSVSAPVPQLLHPRLGLLDGPRGSLDPREQPPLDPRAALARVAEPSLGRGPGLPLSRRGGLRGPEERGELFLGGALEGELLLEAADALGEEEGLL